VLIEKFKLKNGIKKEIDNNTKLFQKIINKNGLSEKDLKLIKESNLMDNIEFNDINLKIDNSDKKTNSNDKINDKPKYYI